MSETAETPPIDLSIEEELFCKYYTQNTETYGNATMSYAEATKTDLDSLSKIRELDKKGKEISGTSEYDKAYAVCSVQGWRLLRKDKIQKFIRVCLNEILTDEVVDSELAKVILQDGELDVKVNGIKEYNKLRKRITEKMDLTSDGKIVGFTYVVPEKPKEDGGKDSQA